VAGPRGVRVVHLRLGAGALDDGILTADEFFGLATASFSFPRETAAQ
jgi:hypothetical protein